MKKGREFLVLDIGSAHMKALVGSVARDGALSLSSVMKMPARGMKRGMVDDPSEVAGAINQLLVEVRHTHPEAHKAIYAAISSGQVKAQSSRGIVAVSRADSQIHHDDIMRVEAAAQAMNIPQNRAVIHLINQEYVVDGITGIRNPLGMVGSRLELVSMIVDIFEPAEKELVKAIETAGGECEQVVFGPLAAGKAVLTKNQRDLGVVLIDIGSEVTSIAVHEDGKLLGVASFPVGASSVTKDVAVELRISIEAAELVKCSYGAARAMDIPARDMIDLSRIDPRAKGAVPRRLLSEIIEARYEEIFGFVNEELKRIGKAGRLPAGVVLTGGGAKIAGAVECAREVLRLPAQVGVADFSRMLVENEEMVRKADDPEFACVVGLAVWAKEDGQVKERPTGGVRSAFRKVLDYFMP